MYACHLFFGHFTDTWMHIVDDLGKGLGPTLVSLLNTTFDRQTAFNISLFVWIIGGMLSLFIILFGANDNEKIQQKLREQMLVQDTSTMIGEVELHLFNPLFNRKVFSRFT
jgi:hypothetical protein